VARISLDIAPAAGGAGLADQQGSGSLAARLLSGRTGGLLARNTLVSCFVFAVDLAMLWLFVEQLGMGKLAAATVAFVLANTIHYAFCRVWIFSGTERAMGSGYVYFLINAAIGLVLTIILFAAFIAVGLHYIAARVVASVFAGLATFLLNAVLNFRSV